MIITPYDLLGTAAIAAGSAKAFMEKARGQMSDHNDGLQFAEAKLVQALCELRAARWALDRDQPFDDMDLDLLLDDEAKAIRSAHGNIPALT